MCRTTWDVKVPGGMETLGAYKRGGEGTECVRRVEQRAACERENAGKLVREIESGEGVALWVPLSMKSRTRVLVSIWANCRFTNKDFPLISHFVN